MPRKKVPDAAKRCRGRPRGSRKDQFQKYEVVAGFELPVPRDEEVLNRTPFRGNAEPRKGWCPKHWWDQRLEGANGMPGDESGGTVDVYESSHQKLIAEVNKVLVDALSGAPKPPALANFTKYKHTIVAPTAAPWPSEIDTALLLARNGTFAEECDHKLGPPVRLRQLMLDPLLQFELHRTIAIASNSLGRRLDAPQRGR